MTQRRHDLEMTRPRRVFSFLLAFRWLSLVPALVMLALTRAPNILAGLILALAVNLLVTVRARPINRWLKRHPWLFVLDLAFTAGLISLTGGWLSPFYLYSLSPLLIAAFFFGLRGATIAAAAFSPLYVAVLFIAALYSGQAPDWLFGVSAVVGFFLLSGTFGFASNLVARLRRTGGELGQAHRDLALIHDLIVSLQSAADVEEVQERVLDAVTGTLGFRQAAVGLVNQDEGVITGWLRRSQGQAESSNSRQPPHLAAVPLNDEGGVLARQLLGPAQQPVRAHYCAGDPWVAEQFGLDHFFLFPMMLRQHPVGILLVETDETAGGSLSLRSLEAIANQAAVAVGATMLCIDRARRLAVQEERLRIAQEIHDTVSQSLFGITFTLEGCLKALPAGAESLRGPLSLAFRAAEKTRTVVRQSIHDMWPSEVTAESFEAHLRQHMAAICRVDGLNLSFTVSGSLEQVPSRARRSLYRIAQEALTNVAHHAGAASATVCLEVGDGRAWMVIQDDGIGFDPGHALAREYDREHFGLKGIQQRVESLGGECSINSQPGAGATVMVDIPLLSRPVMSAATLADAPP